MTMPGAGITVESVNAKVQRWANAVDNPLLQGSDATRSGADMLVGFAATFAAAVSAAAMPGF